MRHPNLARVLTRLLTSVALAAQVVTLAAPLVDVQADQVSRGMMAVLAAATSVPAIGPSHGTSIPHNPTTCPACIAQSLHAQLSATVRLPTLNVAERAPSDQRAKVDGGRDPPATHQSRAPPAVA
ncbi:MAG TPA: hypothetical protein VGM77_13550 [Gemmatimonadales bacterium]